MESQTDKLARLAEEEIAELDPLRQAALNRGNLAKAATLAGLVSQAMGAQDYAAVRDAKEDELRLTLEEAARKLGVPIQIDFY